MKRDRPVQKCSRREQRINAQQRRKKRIPIARSAPPKKTNPARRRKEFARCYGSKERVAFIRTLACAACGVVGYSENAHLLGNGGMGRKADADTIGPLCGPHPRSDKYTDHFFGPHSGHHTMYDEKRSRFDLCFPDFDPERVARETEELWRASLGSAPGGQT